jgi:hypothetical protein
MAKNRVRQVAMWLAGVASNAGEIGLLKEDHGALGKGFAFDELENFEVDMELRAGGAARGAQEDELAKTAVDAILFS